MQPPQGPPEERAGGPSIDGVDPDPMPGFGRSTIQRSLRSSATARMLIGSFGAQALIIASGILAARLLGPTDRGYLAFLALSPMILATVGGLGLPQALTYWAARDRGGLTAVIRAIAPIYVIQLVVLTLINFAVLIFFVWPASAEVVLASLIFLVATPAILSLQYAVAIAQGEQRFGVASVVFLLAPTLYVGGLLVLAVSFQARLAAVSAAWSLAYLCAALLSFVLVLRGLPLMDAQRPRVKLRDLAGFGLRGLPSLASPLQTLRLDQLAVWLLLGPLALGLYVVAQAFTNLPILLANFMGLTISGKVASQTDARAASRSLAAMVAPVAAVSLTIAAVVGVGAAGLISFFFGSDFSGAAGPARILLVGAVAASLQRTIGDGLRALGDPAASTFGEAVSWIVLTPGILILPPAFGLEGVALAVAASYCAGLATVALRWFRRPAGAVGRYSEVGTTPVKAEARDADGALGLFGPIRPPGQD